MKKRPPKSNYKNDLFEPQWTLMSLSHSRPIWSEAVDLA